MIFSGERQIADLRVGKYHVTELCTTKVADFERQVRGVAQSLPLLALQITKVYIANTMWEQGESSWIDLVSRYLSWDCDNTSIVAVNGYPNETT